MGLLKTLLFILFFYYAFKFLTRLLAPILVKKMADTMQKRAEQQYGNTNNYNNVKEGETIIDKKPNQDRKTNNSVGEYVDFEEID
ncbi:MAG: DUF4834 family protein [Flavobacteriaceae bacterium]|nr:DUF4834 family protein [Flavobacteriaceae bacterium]